MGDGHRRGVNHPRNPFPVENRRARTLLLDRQGLLLAFFLLHHLVNFLLTSLLQPLVLLRIQNGLYPRIGLGMDGLDLLQLLQRAERGIALDRLDLRSIGFDDWHELHFLLRRQVLLFGDGLRLMCLCRRLGQSV